MTKFTLISEHEGGSKTTLEFEEDYLPEVIMHLDMFLRGTGFVFDGTLGIDEEVDYEEEKDSKCSGDCSSCGCGSNSQPTPSVNRVDTISINSSKCGICGLTTEQLGFHQCYDPKCPKTPITYTLTGKL